MLKKSALLMIENGNIFLGDSLGIAGVTVGEIVFNTSITGYQEIITDTSYLKQIIVFTYPHIGNVGTNLIDNESKKIKIEGLILRNSPTISSNYRSTISFLDFIKKNNVIVISNIDTRQLTRIIRTHGSQKGCIISGHKLNRYLAKHSLKKFSGVKGIDLVKAVSTSQVYKLIPEKNIKKHHYKIVVYDYGIKNNIIRMLEDRGCYLIVMPAKTSDEKIIDLNPDGIFLSNGPGDPSACDYAIHSIKKLLTKRIPIFGICLGHQLLALASGATTKKMKFGHHSSNHPVKDLNSNQVIITTQNHGFVVDKDTLPNNLKVTHLSLFDDSIQGIHHKYKPAFGFQGHPEASPGPHDSTLLFDYFIRLVEQYISNKN